MGLNDKIPRINLSHYRALIYRKQYSHLSDLIDKSKELFKKICPDSSYNSTEMLWKFPSGAQIQFTYMENVIDAEKIQGKEFQNILCDELGQYKDDKVMRYALSRLRSSHGLKCYFRATSNPSRYKWLRNMFRIDAFGNSTKFFVETDLGDGVIEKKCIQYIQATLSDNPHLGKDYKAQLMLLPEDERNALLYGRWDSYDKVDGGIYTKEIAKMYTEKRICKVDFQPSFQYYASLDLGRNDTTAIILFQFAGLDRYIFDYYENNCEDINFYIDWLKKKGYGDAKIILPHDSKQKRIEFKYSVYETISQNFRDVTVLERSGLEDGIDISRRMLDKVYIDSVKCERLIECLKNYRRKYNTSLDVYGEPIHDGYSNGADSFRYCCLCEDRQPIKIDFSRISSYNSI